MLARIAFCLIFLTAVAPPGSTQAQVRHEYSEVHMGMPVRVVLFAPTDNAARAAARAAFQRMAQLDADLSDYRPDSELRRIEARAGTWVTVKPSTLAILSRALHIAQLTNGAFDPTVGPLVALWRSARKAQRFPERAALESARALVSYQQVRLDSARSGVRLARAGMRLDLGGIAKGYILQEALTTLGRHGVSQAMLQAGGDIMVGAAPPGLSGWRIDVAGTDSSFTAQAQRLTHAALATSGPNQQFLNVAGMRYSHVVDPRTGLGLTNGVTAHVIARDGATADALATALTILDPEKRRALLARFPDARTYIRTETK
ncbi:MAG: FAD:protein FMN transferase [Longimicrobiales bacterium]